GRQAMRRQAKGVGLAIVGAGRVGLFRGEVAARHPAVQWIGIAEKNHNRGLDVAEKIGADFVTQDHRELLKRPEVTCAIIATDEPKTISPMVISGTHALDIVMWCMEAKRPVECYARSIDKVLGPLYQGIDATAGMIVFSDGSVYHLNISWALPVTWPGAVYSL